MVEGKTSKRVFLRKVLYRLDFQFITEKKQEEIYAFIVEKYGDYFSERGCEQGNEFDIEVNLNTSEAPRLNSRPQEIYYLVHPKKENEDGRTIKIGKTFIFLELDLGLESEFIPYYKWMASIISFLKKTKLFSPTRIGLRKFNSFFMLDENIEKVNEIFEIPFIENSKPKNFALDHCHNLQVYNGEEYSMNFSRGYSRGFLNNRGFEDESVYRLEFDFDLYSENQETLSAFCQNAEAGLEKMNAIIYSFFDTIVSESVCEKIKDGDLLSEYGIIPF